MCVCSEKLCGNIICSLSGQWPVVSTFFGGLLQLNYFNYMAIPFLAWLKYVRKFLSFLMCMKKQKEDERNEHIYYTFTLIQRVTSSKLSRSFRVV